MNNRLISYEKFKKVIESLKENQKVVDELCDVFDTIEKFCEGSMQDTVIDLLSTAMCDKEELISYWVYETNFGEDWDDDLTYIENGVPIILKTTRQLYDYLVKNYGGKTND